MLTKIKEVIDRGDRFLITSHIDPDGDAIGSAFSMYWALDSLKKHPLVYLRDKVPSRYEFLPRPTHLTNAFPHESFDAIFVLDCGNLFRVGEGYEQLKDMGYLINIDHHKTNETFGLINMIDPDASCTAELLYFLYEHLHVPMSLDMALNIYTGILTDTGSFRFGNANSSAFFISGKMLQAGVKPAYVSQMVYNNHPKERFKLLGLVLSGLEAFDNDKIVMTHVTNDMFEEAGASKEDTDGFVEYIKEIRGVEAALLLRQVPGGYKVSMRSRGTMDVSHICALFGGGGHRNAAGCTIEGNLGQVENRLKEALKVQ